MNTGNDNCPLCNARCRVHGSFTDRDGIDECSKVLFHCSVCRFYFFERNQDVHYIYQDNDLATIKEKPRHRLFGELINRIVGRGSILEIGAGAAHILKRLNPNFFNISAIDYHLPELPSADLNYYPGGIGDYGLGAFEKDGFRCIILDNVLEHLDDPYSCVEKVSEWLCPDGFFLVAVPNRWNLSNLLKLDSRREFRHPREHVNIFTRKSLTTLCETHLLTLRRTLPKINDVFSLATAPSLLGVPLFGIYMMFQKNGDARL